MKGNRILAAEFVILVGIASWAALRKQYYPWPPTIVKTALFTSLLGIISAASEEFAATLGAGFILANLVKMYSSGATYMGGLPVDSAGADVAPGHFPLSFKGQATNTQKPNPTTPTKPVNPVNPGGGLGPAGPII